MSLVRYGSRDERNVVLRHNNAVVRFDPNSQQLVLREERPIQSSPPAPLSHCPYCQKPLQTERRGSEIPTGTSFIDPDYFALLDAEERQKDGSAPSEPRPLRRLTLGGPSISRSTTPAQVVAPAAGSGSATASAPAPRETSRHGISSKSMSPGYFAKFFRTKRELGRGGKGVVLLVEHIIDDMNLGLFACKRVPVGDDHAWLEKVMAEVRLLQALQHQNLVTYRYVWLEELKVNQFGPSIPYAHILQQYCDGGDLQQYVLGSTPSHDAKEMMKDRIRRLSKGQPERPSDLQSRRQMKADEIAAFFRDITSGLDYLHKKGFIHRDLKPSNCLLNQEPGIGLRVLISDFGETQAEDVERMSTGSTGTISYCAPELLKQYGPTGRFGNFTTKSDVFSLGLILYFMCFADLPYKSANVEEIDEDLDELKEEITSWLGFSDARGKLLDLPEQVYQMLNSLLAIDPAKRPSAEDILHSMQATADGGPPLHHSTRRASPPSGGPESPIFEAPRELGSRISEMDSSPPAQRNSRSLNESIFSQEQPDTRRRFHAVVEEEYPDPEVDPTSTLVVRRRSPVPDSPPHDRKRSISSSPEKDDKPLLPPPSPTQQRLLHDSTSQHLITYPYRAMTFQERIFTVLHSNFTILFLKIAGFLAKLYSLTSPCFPLASNPKIGYPLLTIAVLDLGVAPRGKEWTFSLVLLTIHFSALILARRWDSMCIAPTREW